MGLRYHRTHLKGKTYIRRFFQTRPKTRSLKWVTYHSNPKNAPGNPFKGLGTLSMGFLLNPEIYRYRIAHSTYYKAPKPGINPYEPKKKPKTQVPSYNQYAKENKLEHVKPTSFCLAYLANLKKCYQNHLNAGKNPFVFCSFYMNALQGKNCAQ